jgi:hypothetical protein
MKNRNVIRAEIWNRSHPEARKRHSATWRLRRFYGIEPSEVDSMHVAQEGKCAMRSCQRRAEAIDHDHVTGKVRGLLCKKCNSLLGFAGDSIQILRDAIEYLEISKTKILKGGKPLPLAPRKIMTAEERRRRAVLMVGNRHSKGSPGRKYTSEQRQRLSEARKSWWDSLSEKEKEEHSEKGRQSALRRWR